MTTAHSYDYDLLVSELIRDEGLKLRPYRDSLGHWTVGVGHLMSAEAVARDIQHNAPIREISTAECDALLAADIAEAERRLTVIFPVWRDLDDVRQRAMLNLTFNLGNRLSGFQRFLAAMDDSDYQRAANALMSSLWYAQVKTRGPRIVRMIRIGKAWEDK